MYNLDLKWNHDILTTLIILIILLILSAILILLICGKIEPNMIGIKQGGHYMKSSASPKLPIDAKILSKYHLTPQEINSYSREKLVGEYVDVASDRQIITLLKSNKKDTLAVMELLSKHVIGDVKKFINKLTYLAQKNSKLSDLSIYNELRNLRSGVRCNVAPDSVINSAPNSLLKLTPNTTQDTNFRDNLHAELYSGYLRKYLPLFKPTVYLDFGCGDCNKTAKLGNLLSIDAENIHGCDIKTLQYDTCGGSSSKDSNLSFSPKESSQNEASSSFSHYETQRNPAVKFSFVENDKLDYEDKKFDLISAFMVFHHVKNIEQNLSELSRVIMPGGVLIVREHDAYNASDYMLCDIEHAIYDLGYGDSKGVPRNPDFIKTYYAKYRDWIEWAELLSVYGFKLMAMEYDNFSIKKTIGPTRYICLIFTKV